MTSTLVIDRRPEPAMPSGCGSGCGCASTPKPAAPLPDGGKVSVNGVEIGAEAIAREIQHHPASDGAAAWRAAAQALVVRELMLQAARAAGLEASPERDDAGRLELAEEALIRAVLDRAPEPQRPGDAECRRYYEANLRRFRMPDLFEASHILIEPASEDAAGWRQAEETARTLAAELGDDPDDFAAAAQAFSACPTARQNGSLGQLRRGELVPEVQAALEDLAEGATGREPVRSRFGWHVLRHQRRIPGKTLSFEMVAAKIAEMLEARAWTMSAAAFVLHLAQEADIEGVALDPDVLSSMP
ncbi:peptidylprolyl isomerase [Antarcticirhabdus aurantiaca]|uniref:Peptidylprolyl isomerase n=1 Tax=Antarcticirhabdus aurantiaca TaxID=2606717 RepID=A0ACD4NN63_9HYPH|nr:peptidylprolyl isomerase [Antarcticirhabdus aurantiaca]WAJ28163.1 peptidylprolyl isomerase [Jeongeuplla avenae]